LPRGLGDDPLSRQRKSARRKATHPDTTVVQGPSTSGDLQAVALVDASPSPSQTSSYNDVFFRKRSEDGIPGGNPELPREAAMTDASPLSLPVTSVQPTSLEPALAEPVASELTPGPSVAQPTSLEPALAEPVASELTPDPQTIEPVAPSDPGPAVNAPVSADELTNEATAAVPAAPAAVIDPTPVTETPATPEHQSGGFLKRMFGRFRK
jgi:hypothetical protein